jgi:putative NIF3 family GTP cyclohydrolase 1 type 2
VVTGTWASAASLGVTDSRLAIVAVGDMLVTRDDPSSMFVHCRHLLDESDIALGHSEGAPSDKGSKGSSGPRGTAPRQPASRAAIAGAGFDVVSLASNHIGDWGLDALTDCIEQFRSLGVMPIGAGQNLTEARTPAVLDRKAMRVAVLAYCSVAPEGYYAAATKHGCAPMRAVTHYEPFEADQPGNPARIMTFPVASDLGALVEDVRTAKQTADVVVVSMHWGVRQRAVIADYQREVAHAAIDAGAEIIFGHHPHILKGIEVYRGKAIFYSLGNFAVDVRSPQFLENANADWLGEAERFYRSVQPATEGSLGLGARQTMIAKWSLMGDDTTRVSLIPCVLNALNEPLPTAPSSHDGAAILDFLREVTAEAHLDADFAVIDGEVVVTTTSD